MTAPFMAAVDWGTTRLRIWLLDADGRALAERRSDEGMLSAGPNGFGKILEGHLQSLGAGADLPVMICGMAGARQGWIEAPYVAIPASLDAVFAQAVAVPDAARRIMILPGMAQRDPAAPDVMRGEETQLAGVAHLLGGGRRSVCLPGTHSKWVDTEGGAVTGFRTFLTGELFDLLGRQSILRHSLGAAAGAVRPDDPAFRDWCLRALRNSGELPARLFAIRASTLLLGLSPDDAAAALSGLLVGSEIGAATAERTRDEIVLVVSGSLGALYAEALALAGHGVRAIDAEEAVRRGLFEAGRRHYAMSERGFTT